MSGQFRGQHPGVGTRYVQVAEPHGSDRGDAQLPTIHVLDLVQEQIGLSVLRDAGEPFVEPEVVRDRLSFHGLQIQAEHVLLGDAGCDEFVHVHVQERGLAAAAHPCDDLHHVVVILSRVEEVHVVIPAYHDGFLIDVMHINLL